MKNLTGTRTSELLTNLSILNHQALQIIATSKQGNADPHIGRILMDVDNMVAEVCSRPGDAHVGELMQHYADIIRLRTSWTKN